MKGVKINNYIDNRIVLSGRKLKNQMQTLIHSNRPRPLVIRHLNYIEAEQQQVQDAGMMSEEKQMLKPLDLKMGKKKKKRNKTTATNIVEIKSKSNHKEEVKNASNKSINKKNISAKKRSPSSSPEKQQASKLMNETQRRLKSASKSAQGLGRRSKSAIIKRNKSPSNIIQDSLKNTKDEASMKIDLSKRKEDQQKKKNPKKNNVEKSKQIKKNVSCLNVTERNRKNDKLIVTTHKTSRPATKSYASSTKNSKPVSARQKRKKDDKGSHIFKNLFETIDHQSEHITLKNLLSLEKSDTKIKQALMKLQDALNSGGSRKKLSEKLELLAEKMKQIDTVSFEEQHQSKSQGAKQENETYRKQISNEANRNNLIGDQQKQAQIKCYKEVHQDQQDISSGRFTNEKIIKDLNESENKKTDFKSELHNRKQQKQQVIRTNTPKVDHEHMRKMLEHVNGQYEEFYDDENPLIGRKTGGDTYLDLADYDSIKSVKSQQQNEKQQQINQLKKFQEESDEMMRKIKQLQSKNKGQSNNQPTIKESENKKQEKRQVNLEKGTHSPRNLEINNYAFEKYPNLQKVKSPKLNTQQINQVIKIKEKILTDRHEKLSELVNVMYEKKLVSPKTYSIHIHSLRQQQQQNSEVLDNYRKHAQELARLLSDIKRQKEEITNIDEMIRLEKWQQAKTVIIENQKHLAHKEESSPSKKPDNFAPKINLKELHRSQQENQQNDEAVYYEGEDSQISQTGFKLVQVQSDELNDKPGNSHQTRLIQIDETDQRPETSQKGFDSNLFFIKEYCIALCQYVRDNYRKDFRQNIGKPMSFDLIKLMKAFRTNKDGSPASVINSLYEDLSYHEIEFHHNSEPINKKIFDEFNRKYQSIKFYGKEESENATLEGIFLSSIYDALNESICIEKPGSTNGQALPWANSSKHLKNLKNSVDNIENWRKKEQQSQDFIFGIAIARIIQWGSCLCGFIPDTVQLENTEIDQEYINHIRQTRTALLLQKMLIDQQAEMHKNDLQTTEVYLNLGEIVFEELIKQIFHEIRKIQFKKSLRDIEYNQ